MSIAAVGMVIVIVMFGMALTAFSAWVGLALGDATLYKVSGIHLSTAALHFAIWWVLIVGIFTALAVHRYRVG